MKKVISTENAPKAIGPYSQAIEAGGVLYVSGQLPVDPVTGVIPKSISEQTEQTFKNIGSILSAAGYSFDNVVKSTVLLADMDDFAAMNEVYSRFYKGQMPARVCCQVAKLPKNAKVEIDVIAIK